MPKPIVFFSHSSKDSEIMIPLQKLILSKMGKTVDIFLSSDGESIPFGTNWAHRIEIALEGCHIMFVFLSPNSLNSQWIYFESGFAYSRRVKVIPIGMLGVDLGLLPPPISSLQGFNISSSDGLSNIVAILNKEFGFEHKTHFTDNQYNNVFSKKNVVSDSIFAEYSVLINTFSFRILGKIDLSIEEISSYLVELGVEHNSHFSQIVTYGLSIRLDSGNCMIDFTVDSALSRLHSELLDKLISFCTEHTFRGIAYHITFVQTVNCVRSKSKTTALLYKTPIKLSDNGDLYLSLNNSVFKVGYNLFNPSHNIGEFFLEVSTTEKLYSKNSIFDLLSLLVENNVITQ